MHLENIHQAKTHLSKLIAEVLEGKEVIICKSGEPLVKLIPFQKKIKKRSAGQWKGKIQIKDDFDTLPAELLAAFKGDHE